MIIHSADQEIVHWAVQRSSPYYYTSEYGLPDPCLKVQCGHVTAYFCEGRLERIWAQADSPRLDDLFAELTQLFRLCAARPGCAATRPGMSLSAS